MSLLTEAEMQAARPLACKVALREAGISIEVLSRL
jgi:hypothetical protein